MMEVSELSRKKKNKGFKVFELLGELKYSKEVHEKAPKGSAADGEYCPKQSGCCWDYLKQEVKKAVA